MSTHLIKTETLSLYAVLHRTPDQGHFTRQDAVLLERIAPHLRRAAKIQVKLEEVEAARRSSEAALDHLTFGLLTVDRDGRVLSMNHMAEDVLAGHDGLVVRRGCLTTTHPAEATSLVNCIRQATESKDAPRQGASLLITRPSGAARTGFSLRLSPSSLSPCLVQPRSDGTGPDP
jgi:PAS domain-containing protein